MSSYVSIAMKDRHWPPECNSGLKQSAALSQKLHKLATGLEGTRCFHPQQSSGGKVMFSQVSVILFNGGVWQTPHLADQADTNPWADTPLAEQAYTPAD